MIDFPIQPAMAPGMAMLARPKKPPAIPPVAGSSASGAAGLQNGQNPAQKSPTELQRHLARNRPNDRLVGPPPSFQANVLEVESDIKFAIQQLEVKRETFRNGDAATAKNVLEKSEPVGRSERSNQPPISAPERLATEPARELARTDLA